MDLYFHWAVAIFLMLTALFHAARLDKGWELKLGNLLVPMWFSCIVVMVDTTLFFWLVCKIAALRG